MNRGIIVKDGKKYDEGPPDKVITTRMMKEVYEVDCNIVHVPGRTKPLLAYKEIK